mgnify:CR=1 FL=1
MRNLFVPLDKMHFLACIFVAGVLNFSIYFLLLIDHGDEVTFEIWDLFSLKFLLLFVELVFLVLQMTNFLIDYLFESIVDTFRFFVRQSNTLHVRISLQIFISHQNHGSI